MHELIDQDVIHHMHDLIHYATFEHESFLYRTVQKHMIVEQTDEDTTPVFRFFISMWAMFFKKDAHGMTIFDYYLRTLRKQAIRPTVYSIIQSWRQAFPTFVCIDELRDSYVVVTDLLTGETKHMKLLDMPDEFELEEGQALAGIFVPHGQYIACFGTFFPLPVVLTRPLYVYIQDVWKACGEQYERWIETYPETFQKSLRLTMFDVESLSPKQEQVFILFEQNFPKKICPFLIPLVSFGWNIVVCTIRRFESQKCTQQRFITLWLMRFCMNGFHKNNLLSNTAFLRVRYRNGSIRFTMRLKTLPNKFTTNLMTYLLTGMMTTGMKMTGMMTTGTMRTSLKYVKIVMKSKGSESAPFFK